MKLSNTESLKDDLFRLAIYIFVIVILLASATSKKPDGFSNNHFSEENMVEVEAKLVELVADGYAVYSVDDSDFILSKNIDKIYGVASITKVMTAIVVAENLDLSVQVTISGEALSAYGSSGLFVGDVLTAHDLLIHSLISSSNDAVSALAEYYFKEKGESIVIAMNNKARELGLFNTYFYNPSGLDVDSGINGGYSTPKEVALLYKYFYETQPAYVSYTKAEESALNVVSSGEEIVSKNTNKYVSKMTGVLGSKTGYTSLVGGNLVVVLNKGISDNYIIVVLESTYEDRFKDVSLLSDIILKYHDK